MESSFVLLPHPRQIRSMEGGYTVPFQGTISISAANPQALAFTAGYLKDNLWEVLQASWNISSGPAILPGQGGIAIYLTPEGSLPAEGYHLRVTPAGIEIQAGDTAGIYYASCTLVQLLRQSGAGLPGLEILDWPDFNVRGVMLDISRDKVPTLDTLYKLVDRLSTWKINQFQLYTEHTFAYHNHPEVWAGASPITGEEILALDAYCRERFIELVPNQNSFGHMNRWLKHPAYAHLGEVSQPFQAPWGMMEPFSLCPGDPGSLALVDSLFDELLPYFSSRMVNAGCDETFDLGYGRSKAEVEARGEGRVYLDYVLKI
jgi:hexosaminidase